MNHGIVVVTFLRMAIPAGKMPSAPDFTLDEYRLSRRLLDEYTTASAK